MASRPLRPWLGFVAAIVYFLAAWWVRPLGHENPLLLWVGALPILVLAVPSLRVVEASLVVPALWLLFGIWVPVGGGLFTLPLVAMVLLTLAHHAHSRLCALAALALVVLWADLPSLFAGFRPDPFRIALGAASGLATVAVVIELFVRRVPATALVRTR